jgi:hypothetical protein
MPIVQDGEKIGHRGGADPIGLILVGYRHQFDGGRTGHVAGLCLGAPVHGAIDR